MFEPYLLHKIIIYVDADPCNEIASEHVCDHELLLLCNS